MSKKSLSECLNCGSIWSTGTEEHDWQQCSACGWRPGMPIDEDDDDYISSDDIEDDYYDDERNDPNDSRNL